MLHKSGRTTPSGPRWSLPRRRNTPSSGTTSCCWRRATSQHPLADSEVVRVGELGHGYIVGGDLQHGKVGYHVDSDDRGDVRVAVRRMDLDLALSADDVVVGNDVAVWADDDSRAGPLLRKVEEQAPGKIINCGGRYPGLDLLNDVRDGRQCLQGRTTDRLTVEAGSLGGRCCGYERRRCGPGRRLRSGGRGGRAACR